MWLLDSKSRLSSLFVLALMVIDRTRSTAATTAATTLDVCELTASDGSCTATAATTTATTTAKSPYMCADTKQVLKCPGEAVGFTCDYTAPFSQRDGDHYFCDFDVIDPHTVSVEEFRERYMFRKPVLINTTLADWSDPQLWTRAQLIDDYNEFSFDAGKSLELVLNSGIGTTNSTLAEYFRLYMRKERESLYPSQCKAYQAEEETKGNTTNTTVYDYTRFDSAQEPMYIFDRSIWKEKEGFQFDYFKPLPYLHNNHRDDYGIFFIGVSGTGASFHGHGETWCGVAYGRKRWFLYPPEVSPPGGFWPGYSMLDWYDRIYRHLKDPLPPDPWMFNRNQLVRRKNVWSRKRNSTSNGINNAWKEFDGLWARKFNRQVAQDLDADSDISTIMQGDCRTKQEEIAETEMSKRRDEVDRLSTRYDDSYLHSEREYDFHQDLIPPQQEASQCIRHDHLYKPMECIQAEGQVIYVPEFWFHAVLNVGDVLAGAIQTSISFSEWMELLDEVTEIEKELDDQKRIKAHKKPLTDLEKQSKHKRLLTIHSTMLRLAPNNAVHNFFVGYEYKVLEVYDKSIEHFSRAIRIDPTYIEAYLGLSDAYRYSNKYDNDKNDDGVSKAERVLRIAYRLNPLHPHVKNKLVDIFQETGQFALIEKVQKSQPIPNIADSIPLRSKNRGKSLRAESSPDINQAKSRGGY